MQWQVADEMVTPEADGGSPLPRQKAFRVPSLSICWKPCRSAYLPVSEAEQTAGRSQPQERAEDQCTCMMGGVTACTLRKWVVF